MVVYNILTTIYQIRFTELTKLFLSWISRYPFLHNPFSTLVYLTRYIKPLIDANVRHFPYKLSCTVPGVEMTHRIQAETYWITAFRNDAQQSWTVV